MSARQRGPADCFYYAAPATLDAYEVLRQFVDGTDELECCFIAVVSSREFLTDEKRGFNRYEALRLRIWDERGDKVGFQQPGLRRSIPMGKPPRGRSELTVRRNAFPIRAHA